MLTTLNRLFGQLQVQPNWVGIRVTGAPLGFHLFDPALGHLDTEGPLPLLQPRLGDLSQVLAIPAVQKPLPLFWLQFWPHSHLDDGLAADPNRCGAFVRYKPQRVVTAEEEVAFTTDYLPFGLARLRFKRKRPAAFNYPQVEYTQGEP